MKMRYKSAAHIFLFMVIVAVPFPAHSQEKSLTPEMLLDLKAVTQVVLSPRGEEYAYVLRVPRADHVEPGAAFATELWMGSLEGDEPRQFTYQPLNVRSLQWSPDGEYIGFLSARRHQDAHTQVYMLPVFGGEARKLTSHETSIQQYRWSPDGTKIAFSASEPQSVQHQNDISRGSDWTVVDEDYRMSQLWVMNLVRGTSERVVDGGIHVTAFEWTNDSKSLVFQASERPGIDNIYMFSKIFHVAVGNGTPEVVTPTFGKLGAMSPSPDGKQLAYLSAVSHNDPIAQSVLIAPVSGGESRDLTGTYEGMALQIKWSDNETLLMLAVEGVQTVIHEINVRTGSRIQILEPGGPILNSFDIHTESGRFMAVGHTNDHPAEVFTGTTGEGKAYRFTNHNPELDDINFGRQEAITWQSKDGWNIQGILTFPLDYEEGNSYPLVLQIHGGPEGYDMNGWTTRSLYPVQLLATRGYMVLQPNYRGSGGRGVAFSKANHNDLGGKEFDDVLSGIDYLVDKGLVDQERIGTGGWSYGGYFSGWAATRYSERFQAAIFCAGLSNWISFTGTTDIPHEMSVVHWNSWWYDEPELHWERSPIAHIDNAETPTLVIHGANDARVAPGQSYELYTALKHKGIPTQLVLYPREGHGLSEREHQLDYLERVFDWFDTYLK